MNVILLKYFFKIIVIVIITLTILFYHLFDNLYLKNIFHFNNSINLFKFISSFIKERSLKRYYNQLEESYKEISDVIQVNQNFLPKIQNKPFIVVIDAGHGAIDSGAIGVNGTLEKEITLKFCLLLEEILKKESKVKVYLTRDSDFFLNLSERRKIAHDNNANLFISVHADHLNIKNVRGSKIYSLSKKEFEKINKTSKLDIITNNELFNNSSSDIEEILFDFEKKETCIFSMNFAKIVISSLKEGGINLSKNPYRNAGFQILKSSDIPSVLIELGYLSNSIDEKLISSDSWNVKFGNIIAKSIYNYANLQ